MFNENSRKKNIILSSSFGMFELGGNYLISFIYRTVFISILASEYLGISSLFTSVLQVLSLTELGIGTVIGYRLYEPIAKHDTEACSSLMRYYKKVYLCIAGAVLLLSLAMFPFLDKLIDKTADVPSDVSLTRVYWLFVIQNVTSYLFVFWNSLLVADQRNYYLSLATFISQALVTIVKIIVLLKTKNYEIVLEASIVASVVFNFILSRIIKNNYKEVDIKHAKPLSKNERKDILKDSGSLMCHKIGGVLVNSSDSIILTKFVGLATLGLYSNYSLIYTAVDAMLNKMLGSFVSSIGSLSINASTKDNYKHYVQLLFVNLWISSLCSVIFYTLINPFVTVWLGENYLLDSITVIILATNLFINTSMIINYVFISANGLFVLDKIRPIIQGIINIIVSIVFVKRIGIAGVFLGTVVSVVSTVWWREGVILYKKLFNENIKEYFVTYICWFVLNFALCIGFGKLCSSIPATIWGIAVRLLICFAGVNLIYFIMFRKNPSFIFFKDFCFKLLDKIIKRFTK